ncbi:hypothetical protein C3K47_12555 [Solitalea longa]|uniref:Uncharacterized protein n=1 Tax=Solitalea longa TaxID=2079460 RepID=A0A2S5A0D6_9SPHI|nr:hypothetical protein [Solitalea longa]POY36026.1 hypothetical protein C3K47_12555 [Solitalea longa]
MKFFHFALIIISLGMAACSSNQEDKDASFRKTLNNNWIEIKRCNLKGGLFSTYGERYKADWLMFIDENGYATVKTPKDYYRNIFVRPDSIMKWDKYKYRIIKIKTDTLVLEYIPNRGDSINKPHHLMFVSEKTFKKTDKETLAGLLTLTKNDTLFLKKLSDSCKRSPNYFFSAEKQPIARSLDGFTKIDTAVSDDGRMEFKITEYNADVKNQHLYSGKFIVRENGQIGSFDVGLMAWGGEEILPATYKYIKHFVENKIKFEPGTTLGARINTYVYFTFTRTPDLP